jgi:hypothetical protein
VLLHVDLAACSTSSPIGSRQVVARSTRRHPLSYRDGLCFTASSNLQGADRESVADAHPRPDAVEADRQLNDQLAGGLIYRRTTEQRGPRDLVAGSVREQSRVERAACSTWLLLSARSRPVPVLARRCKSRPHGAQSPGVSTPNPGSERSRSSAGTEARTQAGTVSRSV